MRMYFFRPRKVVNVGRMGKKLLPVVLQISLSSNQTVLIPVVARSKA
jgi:hypothetical protein